MRGGCDIGPDEAVERTNAPGARTPRRRTQNALSTPLRLTPPSRLLAALEPRALAEVGWFLQSLPVLRSLPQGDGHPVLVLPGFLASDRSTGLLRRYLRRQGYAAHAWQLGRNFGLRPGLELSMHRRLRWLRWRYGRKVSIVGWSLGGIYARELARLNPEHVRQIITLGSPFAISTKANHAWKVYELLAGESVDAQQELLEELRQPLAVPSTAVYTRTDGVVAWQCCLETEGPHSENVEVLGSHCGLGHNPMAVAVVADRLAQSEGEWSKFTRHGVRRVIFRKAPRSPEDALQEGPHETPPVSAYASRFASTP